jgi:hypothetical protein
MKAMISYLTKFFTLIRLMFSRTFSRRKNANENLVFIPSFSLHPYGKQFSTITQKQQLMQVSITSKISSMCNNTLRLMLLTLTVSLTMITFSSKAQTITNYSYAASSGTFTALVGADSVRNTSGSATGMIADGVISAPINIGFPFVYMGSIYSSCRVSTDGYLTFNTSGSNTATNALATNTTLRPTIAPLWDDLDGNSGSGKFSYKTEGVPGSRVFTVEWLNWEWNWNVGSAVISFQVKLYEANGAVQFVYNPNASAAASGTASAGINGGTVSGSGTYLSLSNLSSTATVSSTTETTTISAKPVSGQTYTFTPPAAPLVDPSSLTFSNIGLTSVTLNWTGASPTTGLAGYAILFSTDGGATFQAAGSTGIANNTFTVTGLTPGTTYTFAVHSTNEGAISTSPATGFQSTNSC